MMCQYDRSVSFFTVLAFYPLRLSLDLLRSRLALHVYNKRFAVGSCCLFCLFRVFCAFSLRKYFRHSEASHPDPHGVVGAGVACPPLSHSLYILL